MPFYLYRKNGDCLVWKEEVSLAGNREGLIYPLVKRKISSFEIPPKRDPDGEYPGIGWEITVEEILAQKGTDPQTHRIVIDLKPSDKEHVSLYLLRRIIGFSYDDWSPVALQMETIFVDEPVENLCEWGRDPDEIKDMFLLPEKRDLVHEFLYLRGGYGGGTWTWGRVGSVNGALLWPNALKFFISRLYKYLR